MHSDTPAPKGARRPKAPKAAPAPVPAEPLPPPADPANVDLYSAKEDGPKQPARAEAGEPDRVEDMVPVPHTKLPDAGREVEPHEWDGTDKGGRDRDEKVEARPPK